MQLVGVEAGRVKNGLPVAVKCLMGNIPSWFGVAHGSSETPVSPRVCSNRSKADSVSNLAGDFIVVVFFPLFVRYITKYN